MPSRALNRDDFFKLEQQFTQLKTVIQDKFFRQQEFTEDLNKGFMEIYLFLDQTLSRAGKKPIIIVKDSSHLEHKTLESLQVKLLAMFDEQFQGNEEDRVGKLYEFIEQKFNDIMIQNEQQKQEDMLSAINSHSQLVK